MIGINIGIVFEETESNGENCIECGKPITGKAYEMMLQVGPTEMLNIDAVGGKFCELCKVEAEKDS